MYLRIIGAFLVMFASTGIGLYFGSNLKDRLEKLQMLKQQFTIIRSDISYASTTLPEAMQNMAEQLSRDSLSYEFAGFYRSLSKQLMERSGISFQEIWENAIEQNLKKTTLTNHDLQLLSSLGGKFGGLDRDLQLKTIDLYLARLEEERLLEVQKAGEKMRLYRTLGLLAGAFLVVVML